MPKFSIHFPEQSHYQTRIDIHDIYINRGNHVGNSRFVDLCNEVSLRFFRERGWGEYQVGEQVMINTGIQLQLRSEARLGETLQAELAFDGFHARGCDFLVRLSNGDRLVALACLGFLTFDYQRGEVVDAAANFRQQLTGGDHGQ